MIYDKFRHALLLTDLLANHALASVWGRGNNDPGRLYREGIHIGVASAGLPVVFSDMRQLTNSEIKN